MAIGTDQQQLRFRAVRRPAPATAIQYEPKKLIELSGATLTLTFSPPLYREWGFLLLTK